MQDGGLQKPKARPEGTKKKNQCQQCYISIKYTTFSYHNRLAHYLNRFTVLPRLSTRWRCTSTDATHFTFPFLSVLSQWQLTYSSLSLFNSNSVVCVLQMWWTWIWSQLSGCCITFSQTTKTQTNTESDQSRASLMPRLLCSHIPCVSFVCKKEIFCII